MKSKEYTLARFIVKFPEQDNGMTDEAIKRNVYRAMEAHAENDAVEFLDWIRADLFVHIHYERGHKGYDYNGAEMTAKEIYDYYKTHFTHLPKPIKNERKITS